MALQLFKIASTTVESPQASIDFTSIPSGYTDLVIKLSLRNSDNNDYLGVAFNNSTVNFTSRNIYSNGTSAGSQSRTDQYISGSTNPNNYTTNTFSSFEFYIPNYTFSNNKSFSIDTLVENNGTTVTNYLISGLWSNTAAITRITFNSTSTFNTNSTATLYGVL